MTAALRHRGPDDDGLWSDAEAGIGLGHRRLAILDLSAAGRQPMLSADGRWVLSFNGEIYTHLEVRRELEQAAAIRWRGHSDTETLIEAVARWGLEGALGRCAGMFALALWDRRERRLQLARDRFGEKPLYYARLGGDFVFASELGALRLHPRFAAAIDRRALGLFAARGYVPAPLTIYEGVAKLEPAAILTVAAGAEPRIEAYWSYREVVAAGLRAPIRDRRAAREAVESALAGAVREQAVADVPVGAFLSGGIDSSTIVALHRRSGAAPLRTFSIGFDEAGFDESRHAEAVAHQFGTAHETRRIDAAAARALIPALAAMNGEPFADPAQLPTILLAKLARESVTVALTGDGGDELFGGYPRHRAAARLWRLARGAPHKRALSALLRRLPLGARLDRSAAHLARASSLAELYSSFRDEWTGERSPVIGARPPAPLDLDVAGAGAIARMMHADAVGYLPDDLLCKVDRAAMAASLETRLPFLDHRVAAVAARVPLGHAEGKAVLRDILHAHAPPALFDRPKAGFTVPIGAWLRGPLRDWAESLLAADRLSGDGYFRPAPILRRWREHLAGRREAAASLWPVLIFNAWLDAQTAAPRSALSPPPACR